MPYIKKPQSGMKRLLLGYDLTAPRLATVLGCSIPTARARLNDPSQLTLADLDKIRRIGHVPIEEIRERVLT